MRASDAGLRGEAEVARYLRRRKYRLLAHQWKCRFGELDLIAQERDGTLCFVEVKLRNQDAIALPREFVDQRKQMRLRRAAAMYMSVYALDAPVRFDVAEVYEEGGNLRIVYLKDAFT